jgi:tRNA-specific 2-thiouridylase
VVGPRQAGTREIALRDVNWLIAPPAELRAGAKLRARDAVHPGLVRADGDGTKLVLDEPALAAPGQAAVFYEGTRILGGGFIV